MGDSNYKRTLSTTASASQIYAALTVGIEHWWTKPDQKIGKVGDRAKFTFPPGKSYWSFEAIKLVANELIELKCVEALHLHEGMPKEIETEWLGSTLKFTIGKGAQGNEVTLEHLGLSPKLYCYDVCEAGWDFFFVQSLKQYLDTGSGSPHHA